MKRAQVKAVIIISVLVLVVMIICILLIVVQVPYTANVVYNEKEPYQTQSCHEEKINWVLQSPCSSSWDGGGGATGFRYSCKITNEDEVGGIFKVEISTTERWTLASGESVYTYGNYSKEVYIAPHETKEVSGNKLWAIGTSPNVDKKDFVIISPTKQVCSQLTNYKDTEKTSTETRYCSAWKKLIGQC